MFINRFFVTLVIRPGATGSDKIIQLFKRACRESEVRQGPLIDEALVELLDDKARDFEKLMARCEPRRCSIYAASRPDVFRNDGSCGHGDDRSPSPCPRRARASRRRALPLAHDLSARKPSKCEMPMLRRLAGSSVSANIPRKPHRASLRRLLSVDFGFVLTQSFTFLGRAAATEKFRLRMTQMENAGDRAVSQADALIDAAMI
jgi:type IV secretion system protein VirB4